MREDLSPAQVGLEESCTEGVSSNQPGVSRRGFLARMAETIRSPKKVLACKVREWEEEARNSEKYNVAYALENFGIDKSYLRTMGESVLLMIGSGLYASLTRNVVKQGNAHMKEDGKKYLDERPLIAALDIAIIRPVLEEVAWRLVASVTADGAEAKRSNQAICKKGSKWDVGIPMSIAFALSHNLTSKGFATDRIPTVEFFGGIFFWYLMRERGFDHACLAHATCNSAVVCAGLLSRYPSRNTSRT